MENIKIVWCLIQGASFEGEWLNTLKVFSTEEKAIEYRDHKLKACYSKVFIEPREIDCE